MMNMGGPSTVSLSCGLVASHELGRTKELGSAQQCSGSRTRWCRTSRGSEMRCSRYCEELDSRAIRRGQTLVGVEGGQKDCETHVALDRGSTIAALVFDTPHSFQDTKAHLFRSLRRFPRPATSSHVSFTTATSSPSLSNPTSLPSSPSDEHLRLRSSTPPLEVDRPSSSGPGRRATGWSSYSTSSRQRRHRTRLTSRSGTPSR